MFILTGFVTHTHKITFCNAHIQTIDIVHHTVGLVKTNNEQAQVNQGIGCPNMAH